MLKRLRQLHISLAAKCQILFGSAVVLIISAALFVPWQRMEQLTEQLNEKAAGAAARTVVADHVLRQRARRTEGATTRPSQPPPATRPTLLIDGQPFVPPHMVLAEAGEQDKLSRFENSALVRFAKDRKLPFFARFYETREGAEGGYRYAQPLYATTDCIECHAAQRSLRCYSAWSASISLRRFPPVSFCSTGFSS